MTQQNIKIIQSSNKIKDSFVSHFKKSFSSIDLIKKNFELDDLHNFLVNDENLLQKGNL